MPPATTIGQKAAEALKQAKIQANAEKRTLSWEEVAHIIDSCVALPGDSKAPEADFGDRKAIPPTPEQVTAYSASIGFDLDGRHFCDHYEAKGWLVGKTKMKDWQAAVRTWQRSGFSTGRKSTLKLPRSYTSV